MPTQTVGPSVGDYVLEGELGRGAFGVVYRAHHRTRPGSPVALKVVPGRGSTDRLLLEPAVLSRLDHPCIVRLEDYFLREDDLVLALELVEGRDLAALLDEGVAFSEADVRELLLQLGSALAAAHARHVIHRDLKPANILVSRTPDGRPRFVLTDFGIGQLREGIQERKHAGGTYLFMAPEQLRGRPGPQSDLWALGVVAYLLLTGRLPFPGPTLADLTSQVLYASPVPPSQARQAPVDPGLERAVLHLLDRSLQERTGSAEELLRELGHRGPPDSVPGQGSAPGPAGRPLDRRLAQGIGRRWVALAACLVLYLAPSGLLSGLLLLGGVALFLAGQREDRLGKTWADFLTLLAYLLLAGCVALRYAYPEADPRLLAAGKAPRETWERASDALRRVAPPPVARALLTAGVVLGLALYVVYLFLPAIAGATYATLRRLQRERLLLDLAREEAGSDRYLDALRLALDSRFEDVGLHLKYAEALFARGRVKEAAVEARLLLRQDPYHFNGNLLLANAYHDLGLLAECVEVCDRYLEVSGYCFEFGELRQACLRRAAA